MRRELLIAAGPGEWRAALVEHGVAVELFVERGDHGRAGAIYLGRVRRLLPALGAALVEIGDDRPTFLPRREIVPRGGRLDEGERVMVQIRREAHGGKAPQATMGITLRGKQSELRWGRPGLSGVEALSPEQSARLQAAAGTGASLLCDDRGAPGWGLKVLVPAPIDALVAEATALGERRQGILGRASWVSPPARLDPQATFAAELALALMATPDRIVVDDPAAVPEIRSTFPAAAVERRPETEWPINLDSVFDQALSPSIALGGGGLVHVEATRAATFIDVDSGAPEAGSPERTGLAVNLSAVGAIARQIRLRALSGPIVIDFVGLDSRGPREQVRAALVGALALDPARPQILGWTRLGHFELVRPRRGRPLAETLLDPRAGGALAKSAVTVAYEALRALRREARVQPGRSWRLTVAQDVATALAGNAATAVSALEDRFGRRIVIEADSRPDRERFDVAPA